MAKSQLNAKEILQDIRSGMDDRALMEKHRLSAQGLQSTFSKLIAAGLLKQSELYDPAPSHERTVNNVWTCPACKMPQPREFEECPQCGVLVSKFKEHQESKERNAQAQLLQEETNRAKELERKQMQEANSKRATLTVSALKREHESVPADFKKKLYPGLMILVGVGNAIAVFGALVFGALGIAALALAILKGKLWAGIGSLLIGLLMAGLTWIVFKTYSEGIQIFLDVSTSLVKSNVLLARILEKQDSQDG